MEVLKEEHDDAEYEAVVPGTVVCENRIFVIAATYMLPFLNFYYYSYRY